MSRLMSRNTSDFWSSVNTCVICRVTEHSNYASMWIANKQANKNAQERTGEGERGGGPRGEGGGGRENQHGKLNG